MIYYSWADVDRLARPVADIIDNRAPMVGHRLFGVPNGGVYAAQAVRNHLARVSPAHFEIVEDPANADWLIDDLVDSGATKARFAAQFPDIQFLALVDKTDAEWRKNHGGEWVSWPWERLRNDSGAEDNVRRIIQFIGDDPTRAGLLETPKRVAKSWGELFSGYKENPADVMKTFDVGRVDEMVLVKDIEFYSTCEHHMLPFYGVAHVAYVPKDRVIGVSKLARVVEIFSRRLQVQERLTTEITGALDVGLSPLGSAAVLEAQHFCMLCRGVKKQGSRMVTSSLTGVFRQLAARAELFQLIRG